MAATDRQPTAALNRLAPLVEAPQRFDFASAMRLCECATAAQPRLGRSVRPGDDAVRIAQQAHVVFAPGSIAAFERSNRRPAGTLRVFLLGLLGPNGPLPLHLTEYVLDRTRRHADTTLQGFLDLFHHRLLSLFWRAIADAEPAVELDRPDQDRFAGYLGALAGYRHEGTADAEPRIDRARRYWIGHFARQVRNAEGLRAIIAGFFGTDVAVEEFVGRWLPMPGEVRCRLGDRRGATLGQSAFLGDSIWDCSQTIRIVCGPLGLDHYERMLPGGESWQRLEALVRSYIGYELAYEVRLVLRADEVPPLRLGETSRIGWTSWLGEPDGRRDADDLLLQPDRPYRHHTPLRPRNDP
ncbi:MAG: type VI secretion system baseplate subunit TssG [Planctomycetota bacterium]